MTADPHELVSDFTEMTDRELAMMIGAFFRAIGWGALAGGGFLLIFTVPIGLAMLIGDGEPGGLVVAFLPLGLALAGTLLGMLAFGLLVTFLLRHFGREEASIYAGAGIVGGILECVLFSAWLMGGFNSSLFFAALFPGLFCAFAGAVAGGVWGAHREERVRQATDPEHPTNPYHDMIY
ncbi:hypothetical protein GCM10023208_03040 [Erythrobacter westpacificensis]|uniref:Uncharacterized protein n=1 Tax=Erythrobacter westpacificensis TaxID=1055231 RepID=A0ABP9JXQ3_9SPHN